MFGIHMALEGINAMTPERERILHDTEITESAPGTILRDFNALLNFVEEAEPQLTAQKLVFSLKTLDPLNELMTHPMQHGLKRPMQVSFPHIDGLFLLSRASGLTYIDGEKKPYLVVDQEVKKSWSSLNATEQYCYLLETWFLRGHEEIVGEDRRPFLFMLPINRVFTFFSGMLDKAIKVDKELADRLKYYPGLRNLALLELFGFVTIESGEPEAGQGWQIDTIRSTPLGDAMLTLIGNWFGVEENIHKLALPFEQTVGEFQPLLQPYFPAWRSTVQLPQPGFQDGLYTFNVSLGKDTWRRIAISAHATLDELSETILKAFDFDNDHLYRYIVPTRFGTMFEVLHSYMHEDWDAQLFTSEVRVGDLPLPLNNTMWFNFDFGDDWYFAVTLEEIDPSVSGQASRKRKPRIIETHGDAPEQYPAWDDDEY